MTPAEPDLLALLDDLVTAEITLWNVVDDRLRRETNLPLGRCQVLWAITDHPGCRVQDVADTRVITVGAVSKLVDRLADAELVQRVAHPSDRRSSALLPTRSGRIVGGKAAAAARDEIAQRLSHLDAAAQTGLAAHLTELRRALTSRGE